MRLRTACIFERDGGGDIASKNAKGFKLPSLADVTNDVQQAINEMTKADEKAEAKDKVFAGVNGVTTVTFESAAKSTTS